jgi:hypothetical protein
MLHKFRFRAVGRGCGSLRLGGWPRWCYVSGVGFWDRPNRDLGHAKNYAELHPVTSIRFLAGCDAVRRGRLREPGVSREAHAGELVRS